MLRVHYSDMDSCTQELNINFQGKKMAHLCETFCPTFKRFVHRIEQFAHLLDDERCDIKGKRTRRHIKSHDMLTFK